MVLRVYPVSTRHSFTFRLVSGEILGSLFKTLETVEVETPVNRAMSLSRTDTNNPPDVTECNRLHNGVITPR